MIVAALHDLTSLLLAGVFCYGVFVAPGLRRRRRLRQVLVALILALVAVFLAISPLAVEGVSSPISAKAGPLLLAGYIGGPLGAAVAAIVTTLIRVMMGGAWEGILAGVFLQTGYVTVGAIVSYLVPTRQWPTVPGPAILVMLAGFVLVQFQPMYAFGLLDTRVNSPETVLLTVCVVFGLGIVSTLITWKMIELANHVATQANNLAKMAERLELVRRTSGVGVISGFADSDIVQIDSQALHIFGMTGREPGEISARELRSLVHPDDRAALREELTQGISELEDRRTLDYRAVRPSDGAIRHLWINRLITENPETGRLEMTAVISDVTDLRDAEDARSKALERIASVADSMPGVVFQMLRTHDKVEAYTYFSEACRDYWGASPEELIANPDRLTLNECPEDVVRVSDAMDEGVRTGEPVHIRARAHHPDGTVRWVDFHASAVRREDGLHQFDGVIVDVTPEVEAMEEAQRQAELAHRAQRMESIGQLTGGVAHDFNNLLAVIMGNLELMEHESKASERQKMIDASLEATRRGAELTRSMLSFARRARLDPEPLDLNKTVRHAKNWMRRALPEAISVETSLLAGLWPVRLDASSLENALLNLILNARDAMEGQGKLTIETANIRIDQPYVDMRDQELIPGRYVMLAVSDTGTGINADALEHIFEPFYTTKAPGKGSGVGLSMIEGFVKQSCGTVQVYSELGEGTTFKLYFPVSDALPQTASPSPPREATKVQERGRILLAEDEAGVREVLAHTLRQAGYDVRATASGDEALGVFKSDQSFDLLVTDIVMPGELQGTGLARAIRGLRPEMPMIFMSGYAAEATVHGNGLKHEDIRLMKPVPKVELLGAVAKALKRIKDTDADATQEVAEDAQSDGWQGG